MVDKTWMQRFSYFFTLKGIIRSINLCYFAVLLILGAILSGVAVGLPLRSGALGFSAFLSFSIVLGEIIMIIYDLLDLSVLKPYAFWILLAETIGYAVAAVLVFLESVALTAYAATAPVNSLNAGVSGAGAFFGFIGLAILGTTIGIFVFFLVSSRGVKKTADPV